VHHCCSINARSSTTLYRRRSYTSVKAWWFNVIFIYSSWHFQLCRILLSDWSRYSQKLKPTEDEVLNQFRKKTWISRAKSNMSATLSQHNNNTSDKDVPVYEQHMSSIAMLRQQHTCQSQSTGLWRQKKILNYKSHIDCLAAVKQLNFEYTLRWQEITRDGGLSKFAQLFPKLFAVPFQNMQKMSKNVFSSLRWARTTFAKWQQKLSVFRVIVIVNCLLGINIFA